jgi:hypothetical protein
MTTTESRLGQASECLREVAASLDNLANRLTTQLALDDPPQADVSPDTFTAP